MVADRLEVAADEEEVDAVAVLLLEARELGVDGVELAVAAALDRDLRGDVSGLLWFVWVYALSWSVVGRYMRPEREAGGGEMSGERKRAKAGPGGMRGERRP